MAAPRALPLRRRRGIVGAPVMVPAVVITLATWAASARRVNRAAQEELGHQAFPIAGLKAAGAAFASRSHRHFRSPQAAFVGGLPGRISLGVGHRERVRLSAQLVGGNSMPEEWRENLWNIEPLAESEDDLTFSANVGSTSGQAVKLMVSHPETQQGAMRLTREIGVLSAVSGKPGFITMYKADYVTSHTGHGQDKVKPKSDVFMLLESTIGNLNNLVIGHSMRAVEFYTRIRLFVDILRAANDLKQMRIVHSGLTPERIHIVGDPDSPQEWRAVLCDFGCSFSLPGGPWPSDFNDIRLRYMAPEVHDPSRDMWTLGLIFYQLLSVDGSLPEFISHMKDMEDREPSLNNETSFVLLSSFEPRLGKLIQRMLHKVPSERISTEEALAEIESVALDQGFDISPRSATPSLESWAAISPRTDADKEVIKDMIGSRGPALTNKLAERVSNPLELLPVEWNNNLQHLQVIAETKDSILMKGRVRGVPGEDSSVEFVGPGESESLEGAKLKDGKKGGLGQSVLLRYLRPAGEKQIKAIRDEIDEGLKSGKVGSIALYKATTVEPGHHVFMLMEASAGSLEQLVLRHSWHEVDYNVRIRLLVDLVRAAGSSNGSPMSLRQFSPENLIILGEEDEPEEWRAAFLRDFNPEEELDLEKHRIRQLGLTLFQMFSPRGALPTESMEVQTEETKITREQLHQGFDLFKVPDPPFMAINAIEPQLEFLLDGMLSREWDETLGLEEVLFVAEELAAERGIDVEPREVLPVLEGWSADAPRSSELDSIGRELLTPSEQARRAGPIA